MGQAKHRYTARRNKKQHQPIADPRAGALAVLDRLAAGRATLDALLEASVPQFSGLSRRDRALFNGLVHGVLRWRLRLDAVVETFSDRPLNRMTPAVLNILRLGLFQMLFMDRIPAPAAVNTAVNLTRANKKTAGAAGFVNALLRNVLRDPERFALPDAAAFPVKRIAVEKSFPPWLVSRWVDRLGPAETVRLCDAMNTIPPITLRCNGLRNSLPELVDALGAEGVEAAVVEAVPGALDLISPRRPVFEMQAFTDGRFAVQDAAAQLVSLLLAPRPGETVLDACAGLGGKTMHLAHLMRNRGRIVALDKIPAKLTRLEEEARRLGVSIATTRRTDLDRGVTPLESMRFDRVLLDAPCSGLGVLRRNPDAKWSSHKKDIARFADRQVRFLDRLAPLVKRGGTLVFAVCSMEPEENEAVITRFLKNHADFAISGYQSVEEKCVRPFQDDTGFLRTSPHDHQMDGFFAARLDRRS
jgi:16S rRNA (cytosine967-C5)-methyltransferase